MRGNGRAFCFFLLLCFGRTINAGVDGFHKWFNIEFSSAVTQTKAGQVDCFDHVCFDMNQILHLCVRSVVTEDEAITRILGKVDGLLKRCKPSKSVVFAFDGSAPLAKILLQRKRREDSKSLKSRNLSPLVISPGTDFMERVAYAMEYYAYRKVNTPSFSTVKFYVSGAHVAGEGELKIIDWIKRNSSPQQEESTVLIGGDADLVLQGLALSEVKDLFIYTEERKRMGRVTSLWEVVRSLDKLFPGQSEYIRADLMLLMVLNGNDYLPSIRGMDFGICYRTYLDIKRRAAQSQKGHFYLVDGSARSFNWDFIVEYFSAVAKVRPVSSAAEVEKAKKYPSSVVLFHKAVQAGRLGQERVEIVVDAAQEDSVDGGATPRWRSAAAIDGKSYSWVHTCNAKFMAKREAAAMLLKELLPDVYEMHLDIEAARKREEDLDREAARHVKNGSNKGRTEKGSSTVSQKSETQAPGGKGEQEWYSVETYLTGLVWNLQMYVDGYPPDYYWQYGKPYGPSCAEIVEWIKGQDPERLARIVPPISRAPPMPSGVSCLCLMPLTEMGTRYLPYRLRPLVKPGNPVFDVLKSMRPNSTEFLTNLFKAVQSEAPKELAQFSSSHAREAWRITYMDSCEDASAQARNYPPRPPHETYPPLKRNLKIRVSSMAGASSASCEPWCNPDDPSSHKQPRGVKTQPYKKPFVQADDGRGRGERTSSGGRGRRARRTSPARPDAWRQATKTPAMPHTPVLGKTEATNAGAGSQLKPPRSGVKSRVPPAVVPRSAGSSMSLTGGKFVGRPSCRLRL